MIDVILVKHAPTAAHERAWVQTLLRVMRWRTGLKIWDNTDHNMGLVKARNRLLRDSKADVVVLMDFDFTEIDVDIEAMAELAMTAGVVIPGSGGDGVEPFTACPCNFMVVRRELAILDEEYFTAYADWDLLNRLADQGYTMLQHNPSTVQHVGLSSTLPEKRAMWDKDLEVYRSKWSTRSWRPA